MSTMKMVDLHTQYLKLKEEIDSALLQVVENGQFINGPEVGEFAQNLGQFLQSEFVVPCGNGTDALQLALMALDLQPGDEVITTTFSFVATAEVIALLGLTPVFVDVERETYNISPEGVKAALTPRTKVILPVHLFGQSANMKEIMQIAQENSLYVIEDVAQSLGATYKIDGNTKQLGTIGHIGCTSFFPSKNLGGFGDGGACYTNDKALADKIKMIASHGSAQRYYHDIVGVNSRLDTLQAAVLNIKLKHLPNFIEARSWAGNLYNQLLSEVDGIKTPANEPNASHTYNQYTIRVLNGKREELQKHLLSNEVPSRIYYPMPLHQQKAFDAVIDPNLKLAVAEQLSSEVLSLPMHTEMLSSDIEKVANAIKSFYK